MAPMDFLALKSQAAIGIAASFLSFSFLNAHLIGLHAKECYDYLYTHKATCKLQVCHTKSLGTGYHTRWHGKPFSKTWYKLDRLQCYSANWLRVPACPLHGFVCPLCGHLLLACPSQRELIRARPAQSCDITLSSRIASVPLPLQAL